MREKDKKSCSPFAKSSDNSDLEEQLPPLVVRKFRWWRCENCVQDLLSENAGKDNGIASNSCRNTPFISNPCTPTPSRGNTEKLPLEMEHVPILGKKERNTAVADASAALCVNRSLSLARHTSETNFGIEGANAHGKYLIFPLFWHVCCEVLCFWIFFGSFCKCMSNFCLFSIS